MAYVCNCSSSLWSFTLFVSVCTEEGTGRAAAEHGDGQLSRVVQPGQRRRGSHSSSNGSHGAWTGARGLEWRHAHSVTEVNHGEAGQWEAGRDENRNCGEVGESRPIIHQLGRLGNKSAAGRPAAASAATEQGPSAARRMGRRGFGRLAAAAKGMHLGKQRQPCGYCP